MTDSALVADFPAVWALPRQESRLRTLARRSVTIPAWLTAALFFVLITPLAYPLAFLAGLAQRNHFAALRTLAMVQAYFLCEAAGITASAWVWIRYRHDRGAFMAANFRLECWWAGSLYRAGVRLFSFRVEVEGQEALASGPVLVLSRHVSPIDNLLPAVLSSVAYGTKLRWVINRSLLRDPCIDIVGNRLPNCFVSNGSEDRIGEILRVDALGRDLGPEDGVLIFPEGGLFSPARRDRVLARLAAGDDSTMHERAIALQNLLPPRLGGTMALLDAANGADVVFIAHTGLEDATRYANILQGGLISRRVRIRIWREPASAIPSAREARIEWLYGHWQAIDQWVAANRELPPAPSRPKGLPDA